MTEHVLGGPVGGRSERSAYIASAVAVFSYVVVRAFLVPFTQDEGASFWLYVYTGEFLPFHSHPDAGNHFLSSLFGIIGYTLGGPAMAVVRWGSIVAFPAYAWGTWRLTRDVSNTLVRWCAMLALLLSPYLLDYFSMFRGYGPAMACWLWALHGLVRFTSTGTLRSCVLMAVAMFLGVFCDLSLLPLWPLFLLLAVVAFLKARRTRPGVVGIRAFSLIIIAQLAAIAYAASIALALSSAGLLYHGSGEGYYWVTVGSLVGAVFGTPENRLVQVVTAVVVLAMAIAAARGLKERGWRTPLVVIAIVLGGDVLAREAMNMLLGTNFPQDRAALHLVPLCAVLVALAVDALTASGRAWAALALLLLALPVHVLRTLNLGRVLNDTTAAIPLRFTEHVQRLQAELGRPVMLSGYGQFPGCWAYHGLIQGLATAPMRPDPLRGDPDDARVVSAWQLPEYKDGYHVVDGGDASRVVLLFRDKRPALEAYADTLLSGIGSADEFVNLALPADGDPGATYIRMTGGFDLLERAWSLRLVAETRDGSDQRTCSEAVFLQQVPAVQGTRQVDVMRWLPATHAGKRHLYMYNPQRLPFRMNALRVRLYRERGAVAD